MATEYEPDEKPPQERRESYDFQFTAKKLNLGATAAPTGKPQINNPFSGRDFIDSIFTIVNKDLLSCKLFYFFFFGAFGSLFPLLAIYFKQLGMNAVQGGVLIGFRPFIEFLSVPFWTGMADRWRRGKEMLLFALLCWVLFTLAIAFVRPPAHKCLVYNGTHTVLEIPYAVRKRRDVTSVHIIDDQITGSAVGAGLMPPEGVLVSFDSSDHLFVSPRQPFAAGDGSRQPKLLQYISSGDNYDRSDTYTSIPTGKSRTKRSFRLDPSQIANVNQSDLEGLITSKHSTVVYHQDEVQSDFFVLLILVIVGEFFSAPAITFADCVTLSFLGEDTENYGRQRMFGSLGWGLSMFFVGMALDHATTFPQHPCGTQHPAEKNYTVCFAVFSVLMSCAFLTALQFRYDFHGPGRDIALAELTERVKDKVKKTITGRKKIDRVRLIEEDDEDEPVDGNVNGNGWKEKKFQGADCGMNQTKPGNGSDQSELGSEKHIRIKPGLKNDMVTDALKAPGAVGARATSGGKPCHAHDGSAPDSRYSSEPFFGKWMAVVRMLWSYEYLSVLFVAWFMGFGIGLIFTFLFWHLQDLGGSPTLFGVASIFNHISELLAYFMSSKFLTSFGHVKVLYAGLLGNVIRFLYISWLQNPWWVLPFEFMQGLTHAAVWAACCSFITHAIPGELKSSAQGILQALHHGLGRGCGAVFGGLLVYSYGSEIAFRVYGIVCIFLLVAYAGINYFLQSRGRFSHASKLVHEMLDDSAHLAPHGVPSGISRNLSGSKLTNGVKAQQQKDYGATTKEGNSTLAQGQSDPWGNTGSYNNEAYSSLSTENPFNQGFASFKEPRDQVYIGQTPRMTTQLYQQQPGNSFDQNYGP